MSHLGEEAQAVTLKCERLSGISLQRFHPSSKHQTLDGGNESDLNEHSNQINSNDNDQNHDEWPSIYVRVALSLPSSSSCFEQQEQQMIVESVPLHLQQPSSSSISKENSDSNSMSGACDIIWSRKEDDVTDSTTHDNLLLPLKNDSNASSSSHLPELIQLDIQILLRNSSQEIISTIQVASTTYILFMDELKTSQQKSMHRSLQLRNCLSSLDIYPLSSCRNVNHHDLLISQSHTDVHAHSEDIPKLRLCINDNATFHITLTLQSVVTNLSSNVDSSSKQPQESRNQFHKNSEHEDGDGEMASLQSTYAHLNVYDDQYFAYYNHSKRDSSVFNREDGVVSFVSNEGEAVTLDQEEEGDKEEREEEEESYPAIQVDKLGNVDIIPATPPSSTKDTSNYHHVQNSDSHDAAGVPPKAGDSGCKVLAGMGEVVKYLIHAASQCDEEYPPEWNVTNPYYQQPYDMYGNYRGNMGGIDACSTIATEDIGHLTSFKEEEKGIHIEFGSR